MLDGADDLDEVMQIFLDRSARKHQHFEHINVNEWDLLDPLNVVGATHQFIQPLDFLTGRMIRSPGPGSLPFHGPNSPASQETFRDEEDPESLTTDEECGETEGEATEQDEDQCPQQAETGGETTPNFGRTEVWVEFVDTIPGVTDLEKLMQEPLGMSHQKTAPQARVPTTSRTTRRRKVRYAQAGEQMGQAAPTTRRPQKSLEPMGRPRGQDTPTTRGDRQSHKSLQKHFRRRTARATLNRLIRDFGTPEQEAKTERWSQPISDREAPQPPPELEDQRHLPEKKAVRFQEEEQVQTDQGHEEAPGAQPPVVDLLNLGEWGET